MDNMVLNQELNALRKKFIEEHNLSCDKCELWEKNSKGKCASKVYCIVKDHVFNCNFRRKGK